jgi:aspartyl-tRNA synthetase
MFQIPGLHRERAKQFGSYGCIQFGAPPRRTGFGLDRWCHSWQPETIRDFIAFKNNSGRDVMIDAPSSIDESQMKLHKN